MQIKFEQAKRLRELERLGFVLPPECVVPERQTPAVLIEQCGIELDCPIVSLPGEQTLFVAWLSLVAAIPGPCLYFFRFKPPWPDPGIQLLPSFAESHIGQFYRLPDGTEYPRSDVLNFRFGKTGFRISNSPVEGVLCGLSATPIPKCYAHGEYVPVVIEFFGRSGSLLAEVEATLSVDRFIEMETARKRDARGNTEPMTVPIETPDAPPHRRSTLYDPDPPPGEDSDFAVSSPAPNCQDSKSQEEHTEELE